MKLSQLGILQEISVSKIFHSDNQLRLELQDIDELARSIRQHGLLHAIVVRPKQHKYEVVAGNRRLEAVKLLKLRKINCHVTELSNKEAYEVAIVENVQHKTMSPIEEATAFARYVENYGRGGVSELAGRIGRSQEFVTKRIQLLSLPERICQEIVLQRITPSAALEMLPLNNKQKEEFTDLLLENHLSKNEVRRLVRISRVNDSANNIYYEDNLEKINNKSISHEKQFHLLDRALRKSIAVMKSALVNLDDILDNMGEDWIIKELLMQYRLIIHGDIDTFLKLRRRLLMKMPREYFSMIDQIPMNEEGDGSSIGHDPGLHLWSTRGIWQ